MLAEYSAVVPDIAFWIIAVAMVLAALFNIVLTGTLKVLV